MKIKQLILAAIMVIAHVPMIAENFHIQKNVSYRENETRCVMDIFYPEDTSKELPVIMWFHGGGLTGGDKFIPEQLKTGEYVIVPIIKNS